VDGGWNGATLRKPVCNPSPAIRTAESLPTAPDQRHFWPFIHVSVMLPAPALDVKVAEITKDGVLCACSCSFRRARVINAKPLLRSDCSVSV